MNQNPMQLFQMFAQLKNNPNSFLMAQTMFGKTPEFNQAIEMMRGKDINTKKSIIENVAKEKNISDKLAPATKKNPNIFIDS